MFGHAKQIPEEKIIYWGYMFHGKSKKRNSCQTNFKNRAVLFYIVTKKGAFPKGWPRVAASGHGHWPIRGDRFSSISGWVLML